MVCRDCTAKIKKKTLILCLDGSSCLFQLFYLNISQTVPINAHLGSIALAESLKGSGDLLNVPALIELANRDRNQQR